jgi:hypothetical protein
VIPLNVALRNSFFLPTTASSPGGQTAKISQSAATTTARMSSAPRGYRSMNRVMRDRSASGFPAPPSFAAMISGPLPLLASVLPMARRDRLAKRHL